MYIPRLPYLSGANQHPDEPNSHADPVTVENASPEPSVFTVHPSQGQLTDRIHNIGISQPEPLPSENGTISRHHPYAPHHHQHQSMAPLQKRYTMQEQNMTIGVIVGVLLAVFLACVWYFLYRYGDAIRIRRRSRSRGGGGRRHSKGSRSSGGSGFSGLSTDSAAAAAAEQ